jgi:hypothetical protein
LAVVASSAVTSAAPPVEVTVLQDTQESIVLEYQMGDFRDTPVVIDGRQYSEIALGKESPLMIAGEPALPTVNRSIIIPDDAKMQINVLDSQFYELPMDVISSKGNLLRTVNPQDVPFTFGKVYEEDALYPGTLAELGEPYILRDHRGVVVYVYPFQYNPVAHVLRVYTQISVEVVNVGQGQVNVLDDVRDRPLSLSFHAIYENHFINYGSRMLYPPMNELGDMLIICHDPWIANVQPLADHKNAIGINTAIIGVSQIPGGNNATSIKAYIQQVYDTTDLAFVLLVGDGAQVDTPSGGGGASDPSYGLLAGGDDYPEAIIGRFSAETPGHVDTQVERTIEYELMPATQQDWFKRGTGIASNQGPGDDGEYDDEHMDNIRLDLLAYGYTVVDQFYDPSATAGQVTTALNDGRGIINYCGHGSTTSWSTTGFSNSHVNALVNDNMLPFITSVACVNGNFDGPTCFGEAWLRATNGGEPSGAIGAYMSSVNQSWSPPMSAQDEFVDLLVGEVYFSYGALCFAGSCLMMDEYGAGGVTMFKTWHIFGDPSLRVYGTAQPPTGLSVSPFSGLISEGPNGGPFTPDHVVYTLENHSDAGLDYEVTHGAAWVTVTNASGYLPAGETTAVTVEINSVADTMGNGEYEDIVVFTNLTNHDGDTARAVSLTVGVPEPVHVFDMNFYPGWTMTGEWEYGRPAGLGGDSHGNPDPLGGATGGSACGVNMLGDYSTTPAGPFYLTTDACDCSGLTQVSLRFMRWLNSDYAPYVSNTIEVSTDGTSWSLVWQNGSSEIAESSWSEQVYDISSVANGEPTVYVRWGYLVGSGAWAYSGWNIDDVEIWGLVPEPGGDCPADIDGDGSVGMTDLLELLGAWGLNPGHPADIDGDGTVGMTDLLELLGAWGPCP